MNRIQLAGQVITCTNYTTQRLFNFNPEPLRAAAENFLASGISEIEIPSGVLDPERRFPDTGVDEATLARTKALLPSETKVVATYIGGATLGADNAKYLAKGKQAIARLIEAFPHLQYVMLHPARPEFSKPDDIRRIVETFAQLAEYAASLRKDFQACFHNHYDTNGETVEQVRTYLEAIKKAALPSLRWGPDTGHCHGMGDQYLAVFSEYAQLIGGHFHIKAQVPAFDKLHGKDKYVKERDIWCNPTEFGDNDGIYGGFVCAADPEVVTPFKEIFKIIREKANPPAGLVRGAMEIDIPRQHPRLEAFCGALYFKNVHGVEGALHLSNDEIIKRVFNL